MTDLENLTRNTHRRSDNRQSLDALLDEILVATVCTTVDGQPWCVPTFFARDHDRILIHGSTGAGILRHLRGGAPAVLAVHALDAIVVAHSAFESSANYRSAVIRGRFEPVTDSDQALKALTNRLIPGRTSEVAPNTPQELAATLVLALEIKRGAWIYKTRTGPSSDPESSPTEVREWTGVVPVRRASGTPIADPWVPNATPIPDSVRILGERLHDPYTPLG